LAGVTVKASPVQIKGDTTEFNAGSFKTKPNATAEDLLKKLPGVQVDKDGTVKAQGQNVTRVLVDGKRFW
jgi:cell division protein YceG involved in septum cleavage